MSNIRKFFKCVVFCLCVLSLYLVDMLDLPVIKCILLICGFTWLIIFIKMMIDDYPDYTKY